MNVLNLLTPMGISLGLTILLEEIFAIIIGLRGKKDLLLIVLVNIITNPGVVLSYYILRFHTDLYPAFYVIGLELMVILVEFYLFRKYGKGIKHPLLFSIGINLFSYCIGKLFQGF